MEYCYTRTSPFEVTTSKSAKRLLEFIEELLGPWCKKDGFELAYLFNFHLGDLACETFQREEFIKEIFDQKDFSLSDLSVFVYRNQADKHKGRILLSFYYSYGKFHIYSVDKGLLVDVVEAYDTAVEKMHNPDALSPLIVIEKQEVSVTENINNSGQLSIGGNITNSTIVQESNDITMSAEPEDKQGKKGKAFWSGILANITSQIIWWILCGIVTLFAAYFSLF